MGEVYLNKKPVVEEYEYAYVETSDGATTKVPRNKIYPYVPASEKDVEALSDKLDKEVNQLSKENDAIKEANIIKTNVTSYRGYMGGFFVTDDGKIGIDNDNSFYSIKCKPNTKYKLIRTIVNGKCAIASTNEEPAYGVYCSEFEKSDGNTAEIITGSDDVYLCWYAPTADKDSVSVYAEEFKDDLHILNMPMESGSLPSGKTSWSMEHHENNKRSAYMIKIFNANNIVFDVDVDKYSSITMYCYNTNGEYIGYVDIANNLETYKLSGCVPLPNTEYIKFVVFNSAIKYARCVIRGSEKEPIFVKNLKAREDTEWFTFDVTDDIYTFGRMILPPNYSVDGEKVPLILWLGGSGNTVNWGDDFNAEKLPHLRYLRDEGFAILTIFGWCNKFYNKYQNCGMAYPYPSPTNLKALKTGIEWACDRYNLDYDDIHVMSKSQGGQCATYFASNPIVPFKSIGMFAPVVDYLSMPMEGIYADTRKALAEDMGFVGDVDFYGSDSFSTYSENGKEFFRQNLPQLCSLNEAWTYLVGGTIDTRFDDSIENCRKFWEEKYWVDPTKIDIYTNGSYTKLGTVPVKIWGGKDDNNTPYLAMKEVVSQFLNGGCEAHLITVPNGYGHSLDLLYNKQNITTKLGIQHTDIPSCWIENVEWIRSKMAK